MENNLSFDRMRREQSKIIRFRWLLATVILLSLCGSFVSAQLSTVYVDALNGSDSFSGANPTDSPAGSGPKSTIHAGLTALADGGRLILFAGTYAGDGIYTDGSPTDASDDGDIAIAITK